MQKLFGFVLLAAIFSPLGFLACFLFKKRKKLTSRLVIPAVTSALFILFKAAQMKDFSAGGGDFKGFVFFTLPIVGFCAIATSYALWEGYLYLSRNWHNKKQRPGVAIITVILIASFAAAFTYSDFLLYWPKGNSNPNRVRNIFWHGVFMRLIPAEIIRLRAKHCDIEASEKTYVGVQLYSNRDDLSEAVLEALADIFQNDPSMPIRIAAHHSMTEEMLRRFAESRPDTFLIGIAGNPKTPPDLMEQLYRNKPDLVKSALLDNDRIPEQLFGEILVEMVKDESIDVARRAEEQLKGGGVKFETYRRQMQDNFMIRLCLAPYADTHAERRRLLAKMDLSQIRKKFIEDPRDYVRAWVAKCEGTPRDVLMTLSDDPSAQVLQWIILNEEAPMDIKRKVSKGLSQSMQAQIMRDQIAELADSHDVEMRTELARNSLAWESLLEKLSNDSDEHVRIEVGRNNKTLSNTLTKLSNDRSQYVRGVVAENRKTPPDILKKLSDDREENVRQAVAENKKTPPDILKKLSNDVSASVRSAVVNR